MCKITNPNILSEDELCHYYSLGLLDMTPEVSNAIVDENYRLTEEVARLEKELSESEYY